MNATMKEIENTIKKEIGASAEMMVLTYLFDKGFSFCQSITDEDIENLDGNGLMTKDFVQSLVRCARELAKNFELIDIMKYVRCEAWMDPTVKEIDFYKEDTFHTLVSELEVDEDEAFENGYVTLKVICEEN